MECFAIVQLPPEINVGDGHDLKLPNKVYNKLRSYSKVETKKTQKLNEKKDHSTAVSFNRHWKELVAFTLSPL